MKTDYPQMLDLTEKVFKKDFINKLKKLKDSLSKQQKKSMMTMNRESQ